MAESIAGEWIADKPRSGASSELLTQGQGENEREIGPDKREDDVNRRVEAVSFPQCPVVNKPLKKQARAPEDGQASENQLAQLRRRRRRDQCVRIKQTEYAHQHQNQADEKGVDVKNLPVQRRKLGRVFYPIAMDAKQRMRQRQHDQHAADDAKMEEQVGHGLPDFGFSKTNRPMNGAIRSFWMTMRPAAR